MKIGLVFCMIAVSVGCSRVRTVSAQQNKQKGADTKLGSLYRPPSMDSPIIISDGSVHLRYQHFHNDKTSPKLVVDDSSNHTIDSLDCVSGITSSNPAMPCPITLAAGWTLEILASDRSRILTLSDDQGHGNRNRVFADFHNNVSDIKPTMENIAGTNTPYIDIGLIPAFSTATLTNGGNTTLTCTSPCKMEIHYRY